MNHKKALIDYRRQRAKETMLDARILLNEKRFYSANRKFYKKDTMR